MKINQRQSARLRPEAKKAIIYIRSASNDQVSLLRQRDACEAAATEAGAVVVGIFADARASGIASGRAGFRGVLARAARGDVDFVVAESWSRLTRDRVDAVHMTRCIEESDASLLLADDQLAASQEVAR